jgi:hypothetical protein
MQTPAQQAVVEWGSFLARVAQCNANLKCRGAYQGAQGDYAGGSSDEKVSFIRGFATFCPSGNLLSGLRPGFDELRGGYVAESMTYFSLDKPARRNAVITGKCCRSHVCQASGSGPTSYGQQHFANRAASATRGCVEADLPNHCDPGIPCIERVLK